MNKDDKIKQAVELFEDFTGEEADYSEVHNFKVPDVGIEIGTVDGLMYTTSREGVEEKYIHKFKKNSRPLLAVTFDGKQLIMVGGSYQFTEKGIEDI